MDENGDENPSLRGKYFALRIRNVKMLRDYHEKSRAWKWAHWEF